MLYPSGVAEGVGEAVRWRILKSGMMIRLGRDRRACIGEAFEIGFRCDL